MFDLQMFGTEDTIVSSEVLEFKTNFYDGDDRLIVVDDPREDLTSTDINDFITWMKTSQPLVGDRSNSTSIVGGSDAHILTKTKTLLDLS